MKLTKKLKVCAGTMDADNARLALKLLEHSAKDSNLLSHRHTARSVETHFSYEGRRRDGPAEGCCVKRLDGAEKPWMHADTPARPKIISRRDRCELVEGSGHCEDECAKTTHSR